jgi:hypothetical protein
MAASSTSSRPENVPIPSDAAAAPSALAAAEAAREARGRLGARGVSVVLPVVEDSLLTLTGTFSRARTTECHTSP